MSMAQAMVYTKRIEFKTLIEIEFKGNNGFSPVFYQLEDEFFSMLELFDQVDILIIDAPDDAISSSSIWTKILLRKDHIKNILFLSDHQPEFENTECYKKNKMGDLLQKLRTLIKPLLPRSEDFISIPIETFIHFKVLPFDLYVKISEGKYLKRIPAHELTDDSTFSQFVSRGITELHFEKKNNRDFSQMLINNMITQIEQDYSSIDQKIQATEHVFTTTKQIIEKLGFKPRVIEVCESVLNQISADVLGGKDRFSLFLEKLRSHTELSFHYRLMELTSFIATQMIDETEIIDKREMIKKMIFASMFCDYTLMELGQIHIRSHDQLIKLPKAEQRLIIEHALKASELLTHYPKAPADSSLIIKQHHGSLTGQGLPVEISPQILPLSKCLMAAQEIAYQLLIETDRGPNHVLKDIKLKFVHSPLEDFFLLFERTCQQNMAD